MLILTALYLKFRKVVPIYVKYTRFSFTLWF